MTDLDKVLDIVATQPEAKEPEYMGDGVYANFDGYQLWVWTSNGIRESERIALEPMVLDQLVKKMQRDYGVA